MPGWWWQWQALDRSYVLEVARWRHSRLKASSSFRIASMADATRSVKRADEGKAIEVGQPSSEATADSVADCILSYTARYWQWGRTTTVGQPNTVAHRVFRQISSVAPQGPLEASQDATTEGKNAARHRMPPLPLIHLTPLFLVIAGALSAPSIRACYAVWVSRWQR